MRSDISKNFKANTKKYSNYKPRAESIASYRSQSSKADKDASFDT